MESSYTHCSAFPPSNYIHQGAFCISTHKSASFFLIAAWYLTCSMHPEFLIHPLLMKVCLFHLLKTKYCNQYSSSYTFVQDYFRKIYSQIQNYFIMLTYTENIHTTMCIYLTLLNCALKNGSDGKYYVSFTTIGRRKCIILIDIAKLSSKS